MNSQEIIARAIHEEYLREQSAKGETPGSNPTLVPWEELPETLKNSNRRHAANLGLKLEEIGCYIGPKTGTENDQVELTPEEIETMTKIEHDHWVEERLKDGWEYAPGEKDAQNKKSPWLVPWDKLPEEEKEKDRNPVRKIPDFLAKAGLQIYRKEKDKATF